MPKIKNPYENQRLRWDTCFDVWQEASDQIHKAIKKRDAEIVEELEDLYSARPDGSDNSILNHALKRIISKLNNQEE